MIIIIKCGYIITYVQHMATYIDILKVKLIKIKVHMHFYKILKLIFNYKATV